MKFLKFTIYSLLFAVVFACSSTKNKQSTNSQYTFTKKEGNQYFTLLQLNDVYEIAPIQGGKYGGMARVETVHKNLLKENPNTMLVLAGDFLNPSLIGTMKVDGSRVRGKQMVEVMNAMNFDLVAFGNHEFDLSYINLQERLNESNFDWLSANVLHNKDGKHHYFYKVKGGKKQNTFDSYIKEFKNSDGTITKIGFISVCIPSNPKSYVYYGDMFEEIKRSYNEIKGKVDFVVGLTHLTIAQDKKVAEMLPNVPLIMGGHEHTNSYDKVGDVLITKADANAKTVYVHRLEYNPITKKVNIKSELKEINESIKDDEKVAEVVNKWQKILSAKIKEVVTKPNEVIYVAKEPLDARDTPIRSIQTNMGEVVTKAMGYAFNNEVDCSLVNGGSIRIDDKLSGDITAVDIFRVLPYGGPILKVEIKGSLLKKVLDYGLKAAGTGAYLQRDKVTREGDEWLINNAKINNNKIYKVAFSDYLLKGFDIPFLSDKNPEVINIYTPTKREVASDIRKAVIEYLKTL
ncbi:metallophosphoesterase [Tenacibaculum holothuriorum]|uniref:Metallophosphoesterase n=1 Tax=Tenacibaculum holothuriorum TaxID=1635173 RepID=A0A1Y2PFC1_9FLAO|nr:bifunctional metallophosphatase/5'-nucleotidase [Tenacibaculum holothuriorum]OSY89125.1 metallophosphoesterase [Tenacibaculum holothuriorum]